MASVTNTNCCRRRGELNTVAITNSNIATPFFMMSQQKPAKLYKLFSTQCFICIMLKDLP